MLIKRSLSVLAVCLSFVAYAAAQTSELDTSYARWKSEALKQNPEVPHVALTVAATRAELGTVKVDVLSGGTPMDVKLQIEPGRIEGTGSQKTFVAVGEKFAGSQKLRASGGPSTGLSRLSLIVPATQDLDAIRVTWFVSLTGSEKSLQILIPISDQPDASTTGVVLPTLPK